MEARKLARLWWMLAAAMVAVSASAAPAAAIDIAQIAIDRGVGQQDGTGSWFVEISVLGTDITSATLTSPTGFDIVLEGVAGSDELNGSQRFADLAALDAAFPRGTNPWMIDLNSGELTGGLVYNPALAPDGSVPISAPIFGATDVGPTTTVMFNNNCANCALYSAGFRFNDTALIGRLHNVNAATLLETIVLPANATQLGFTNPLDANTNYRFETAVATNEYLAASLAGDDFAYYQVSSETQSTLFSSAVPEPGTGVLMACGLALLAGRRRQLRA